LEYRREIDGLRAVAVAPVVLFHAGVETFKGGFVGVDVFFVISGFLITSLILTEAAAGTFTLRSFYERRARRILPALFLVVFTCLPFAYLWMMPEEMRAFSASVLSVVLFASNFVFYAQSGYFDQAAELKPLLHTWSLAVEEQYYILFPLLILLLLRFRRSLMLAVFVALFAASLFLAQAGGNFEARQSLQETGWSWWALPSWGFFLLPSRAFELLLGSMLAFAAVYRPGILEAGGRGVREAGSLAGLALIVAAILLLDHTTPFPSVYALVPTVGAALVIAYARPGTIAYGLLASAPFVGLGLISYSLYLWHHPLFAFARLASLEAPGLEVFLLLSLVSVILAALTWRFVERPFRDRQRIEARTVVRFSATAAALLGVYFAADRTTKGFQHRYPRGEFLAQMPKVKNHACRRDKAEDWSEACRYGDGEARVAIIGDSHARALVRPLGAALSTKGLAVADLHVAGCVPVRNFLRLDTGDRCRRQDDVFDYLARAGEIDTVVIASRWATKFEVSRFDNREGGIEFGVPTVLYPDTQRLGRTITLGEAIASAVNELLANGKRVILVYPIPEVGWDVPNYMAKLKRRGALVDDISTRYDVFQKRNASAVAALDAVPDAPGLTRVYPEKFFCNTVREGRCMASLGFKALYSDTNHLSPQGAGFVVESIVEIILAQDGKAATRSDGR
jgi:peptidoglycan/LPS O-acetylase OafA/YrhL